MIDTKMVQQIGYMPEKRGSYEIDNYLLGEPGQVLNPGCWVRGRTIYGDMYIWNQNWGTYSVPVFAYLEHVQTASSSTPKWPRMEAGGKTCASSHL